MGNSSIWRGPQGTSNGPIDDPKYKDVIVEMKKEY